MIDLNHNAMNCQFDQFEAKVNVQSQYSVTLNCRLGHQDYWISTKTN